VSTNEGVTYTVAVDGKPVPVTGPTVITGTMVAFKQIDALTLESAQSRYGVPTFKSTIVMSGDGKVMTVTTADLAASASGDPSVTVYEKQ
jgi:hypothetical protein